MLWSYTNDFTLNLRLRNNNINFLKSLDAYDASVAVLLKYASLAFRFSKIMCLSSVETLLIHMLHFSKGTYVSFTLLICILSSLFSCTGFIVNSS